MKPLEEIFRERLLKAMCENNVTIQEVADGANCWDKPYIEGEF